ncbi:hypothetical protein [Moheibacter sediminis]|uniref:hypothetical protein n=1 Tax=Moheibacter sediminis TaxID=1434700 RepID=UPI00117E0E0C|nr:hypothetical protein [Moheibacter sediminis]
MASGFAFAQHTTVGVRIGSGSSGFESNVTNITSNRVDVASEGEKMVGYVVFDENENVVKSKDINTSYNTSVDVNNLQSGFYYIAVVSENDQVSVNTYVKP